jgi:hypothetical protein
MPIGYNISYMNPYFIEVSSEKNTAYNRKGIVYFKESENATKLEDDSIKLAQANNLKIGFNWTKSLGIGPNNPIIKRLAYEFDMVNDKVARFQLTDSEVDRFSIPEDSLAKPPTNQNMRLDGVGLDFKSSSSAALDPFSFSFYDPLNPASRYLSTKD